jgi:hypothetical protein
VPSIRAASGSVYRVRMSEGVRRSSTAFCRARRASQYHATPRLDCCSCCWRLKPSASPTRSLSQMTEVSLPYHVDRYFSETLQMVRVRRVSMTIHSCMR